ncbi:DUF4040 domain-containing protein [sulfur-oxidizing endosymbiont of Gigantopelta aegis]|uniref:Na(+)/H(+) antiporter subunit B n=1 Tax=sulfur-oxidizing endosymbiont of Gigantopelta aegis TaxID=2794934 RepID=UPI001FE51E22|nr:DUF4040 domain-containing protein [sulfur-oxidizing endosymbiont of Gigantopelta aegis]
MDSLSILLSVFDFFLIVAIIGSAWQALKENSDLFRAITLFITFGLLMAVAWARLGAVDVALAEAAIGSGLTGALLLSALSKLREAKLREAKLTEPEPKKLHSSLNDE